MPRIRGRQVLPFDPRLVGERFQQERERVGLSRAELAGTCGYSSEQVRRVEVGESAPGAPLLAALAESGGDLRLVLLDAGQEAPLSDMEAFAAAQFRDEVRREAREYSRLKADRRKKVLSEDEADLVEAYRELSAPDRAAALRALQSPREIAVPASRQIVAASHGAIVAGRDVKQTTIQSPAKRARKPKKRT